MNFWGNQIPERGILLAFHSDSDSNSYFDFWKKIHCLLHMNLFLVIKNQSEHRIDLSTSHFCIPYSLFQYYATVPSTLSVHICTQSNTWNTQLMHLLYLNGEHRIVHW